MNSNARTRVRAIFLAAIMLVSVVAMSGAFVGGVAAQEADTAVSGGGDALQTKINQAEDNDVIEVTDSETYNQIIIDRDDDASGLTIRAAES